MLFSSTLLETYNPRCFWDVMMTSYSQFSRETDIPFRIVDVLRSVNPVNFSDDVVNTLFTIYYIQV